MSFFVVERGAPGKEVVVCSNFRLFFSIPGILVSSQFSRYAVLHGTVRFAHILSWGVVN